MLNIAKFNKTEIDGQLTQTANDIYRIMQRCHHLYTFYLAYSDADFAALGYNADDIYAIRAFCAALENIYRGYQKTTLLDASTPAQFVEVLVQPNVV